MRVVRGLLLIGALVLCTVVPTTAAPTTVTHSTTPQSLFKDPTPVPYQIGMLAIQSDAPQAIGTDFEYGAKTWSVNESGYADDVTTFVGLNWICDPAEVDWRMWFYHNLTAGQIARLRRVTLSILSGSTRYQAEICYAGVEVDMDTSTSHWVTGP